MLDKIRHYIDWFAGFSVERVSEDELSTYERALIALLENVESVTLAVIERRNAHIKTYFQEHGFRLSRRRIKFNYRIVFSRNITDVSFIAVLPADGDTQTSQYPRYLDQPVSLHVYDKDTSKLLADMGVFANVEEAMQALPAHYTDIRG